MFSWNRLPVGIKAIFFVQIVNRLGDFIVPFLTLILTQIQGYSPAVAGAIVTLATALGSLGGLWAARIADRHSRRDTLVVFLFASGALLAVAGFAPADLLATVSMIASGFFLGAMRPLLGALVADLAGDDLRRAAFSLSYLGVNIGVAIGPLLAGWLFHNALPWMFWIDAITTAVAVLVLLRFVPSQRPPLVTVPRDERVADQGALKTFLTHPILGPFAALLAVYNILYAQMIFTLSLQLVDQFGDVGPVLFGQVWALNAIIVVALTPLAMYWTRYWTNLRSMTLALVFFALGSSVFLAQPPIWLVFASTVLWTAGEVFFSIHLGDLIAGLSPPERRGRYQSYTTFAGSLGFMAAPLAAGAGAQGIGLTGVWLVVTILGFLVAAGFAVLDRTRRTLPN